MRSQCEDNLKWIRETMCSIDTCCRAHKCAFSIRISRGRGGHFTCIKRIRLGVSGAKVSGPIVCDEVVGAEVTNGGFGLLYSMRVKSVICHCRIDADAWTCMWVWRGDAWSGLRHNKSSFVCETPGLCVSLRWVTLKREEKLTNNLKIEKKTDIDSKIIICK